MKCKRCVLDDTVSGIYYYENDFCNYCTDYLQRKSFIFKDERQLELMLSKIKKGRGKYNCIVGISGGLDSSYLLYSVVKMGLRPLAVHIDTGWNTEIASKNIEVLTNDLHIDLKTWTLDWDQFRQVQIAFLRAGVVDVEIPTDHYYLAALYKIASDKGIKYILTGNNFSSEGIMPDSWVHNKGDTLNMLDIYKKHGNNTSIDKLPTLTLFKRFYYYNIKKIENVFLLNYMNYDREKAKMILLNSTAWKLYPVKHGESIFTRFFQRYILPNRFNIDIRKAHLSAMICSGQMTREKALQTLESEVLDENLLESDKAYVLNKLQLSEFEFYAMMAQAVKQHTSFRSEIPIKKVYNSLLQFPLGLGAFLKISNRH